MILSETFKHIFRLKFYTNFKIMKPKHILQLPLEEKLKFINSFDFAFCDCDGVLWKGMTPIENAGEGINLLKNAKKRIAYISNNSGRKDEEYQELFDMCNIKCDLNDLCHTVKNIVTYLQHNNFTGSIYAIGSESLHRELKKGGFNLIDEDTKVDEESFLSFLKYITVEEKISAVILHGYWNVSAPNLVRAQMYLAKNPDCLLITGASDMYLKFQDVPIIGPGIFTKMLADISNREPIVLSKPSIDLCDIVKEKFQIKEPSKVIMIGDMLEQDVGFGKLCGFQTLAVLSGGSTIEDFEKEQYSKCVPDYYADSLGDLIKFFDEIENNDSNIEKLKLLDI